MRTTRLRRQAPWQPVGAGFRVCSLGVLLLAGGLPAGAAEVRGLVLDDAGKPVPNAELVLGTFRDGSDDVTVPVDAGGGFTVRLAESLAVLAATAPGRDLAAVIVTPGVTGVTLRLGRPREVTGKVLGPDGKPAEGVRVSVASITPTGDTIGGGSGPPFGQATWSPVPKTWQERYTAKTDATGVYRLKGMPAGRIRIRFEDARFVRQFVEFAGAPPEVRLEAGCRIHGRIEGFEPRFAHWRAWTMPRRGEGAVTAPVQPDGTFTLSGIPPDRYSVLILNKDDDARMVPAVMATVTAAEPDAQITLKAVRGGVVIGCAVDAETKTPLAGVPISYTAPHRTNLVDMVRSGADGSFRIRAPAGRVRLTLNRDTSDMRPPEAVVDVTVQEGRETAIEFPVPDWLSLAGVVVDTDGKPVPEAMVTTRWGGPMDAKASITGLDGTFRISGVPKLPLTVTAERGDQGMGQPLVVEPPFPGDLRLQIGPLPRVALVGRVVDDAGRPVAGVAVRLEQVHRQGGEAISSAAPQETTTDAQGRYRFTIRDLAAEYRAALGMGEHRMLAGGKAVGDGGAERRFEDIVIVSTTGSVAGRVVDAQGQPVAGVLVFWASGLKRHQSVTDQAGRFRIEGLPERPVALVARGAKGALAIAQAQPGREIAITLRD